MLRRRSSSDSARPLFDGIRFAGQRRFAGGAGGALENQRVGRDDIAGPHAQDVARNDPVDLDLTKGSIAFDFSLERHRSPQDIGGSDGVSFLYRVEPDRERQDRDDNRTADRIAGRDGNDARSQQDQREGLEQST